MSGHIEVLKYRYGSPGLHMHAIWIVLPKQMALDRNLASLNCRFFQQNRPKVNVYNVEAIVTL